MTVHRLGYYNAQGGREVSRSPSLHGVAHPVPEAHPEHGMIDCQWPVSWTLDMPEDWTSGVYLALFTTKDGHRRSTPFVVRETQRASDLLVVLPFTTYQAYNAWPQDGRTGKNLYKGFDAQGRKPATRHARSKCPSTVRTPTEALLSGSRWTAVSIPGLIGVEADGYDHKTRLPAKAVQRLLSESPYPDSMGRGERIQNTSLLQHPDGTMVFVAGTFFWPLALIAPDHLDSRIRTATSNLFNRMVTHTPRT
ncbi:N,N-dimethylformamidase beta subunit family domain-containing protein [Streptomyces sp. NPDC056831]|uniref:N,N-dimethylformamidase beta subunit family domain-containing protein n=1 Tax=Streptomyces sp. NPDC056831 TaxID=3345954 RepID=UPI0036B52687